MKPYYLRIKRWVGIATFSFVNHMRW